AREFVEAKPAVAIVAGPGVAQTNGLFNALAVNALNALAGSVERPGGIYFSPGKTSSKGSIVKNDGIGISPVTQVGVSDVVNPVFASAKSWAVTDALMKVPFILSFGSFIDETSVLADLILPDHSFLESWVHSAPESGSKLATSTVAPPVMEPLHDTR